MKITKTRKTEIYLITLYQTSLQCGDSEEIKNAKKAIALVGFVFRLLNAFTEENHTKIIRQLYFSKNNILTLGIQSVSKKVYMSERTLYFYRQKYCEIVDMVLNEYGAIHEMFAV